MTQEEALKFENSAQFLMENFINEQSNNFHMRLLEDQIRILALRVFKRGDGPKDVIVSYGDTDLEWKIIFDPDFQARMKQAKG